MLLAGVGCRGGLFLLLGPQQNALAAKRLAWRFSMPLYMAFARLEDFSGALQRFLKSRNTVSSQSCRRRIWAWTSQRPGRRGFCG